MKEIIAILLEVWHFGMTSLSGFMLELFILFTLIWLIWECCQDHKGKGEE